MFNLNEDKFFVKQKFEGFELIGLETRNKYQVLNSRQEVVAYAAEQGRGILGFLLRQFLGHWRPFEIHFFDNQKKKMFHAVHPFRLILQRFEIYNAKEELIGLLQQRFSILSKQFDLLDENNNVLLEMKSPLLAIWNFPFFKNGKESALISKKWSGVVTELFTDKDTFKVEFSEKQLSEQERTLILVSSIFIDLQYFERKAND